MVEDGGRWRGGGGEGVWLELRGAGTRAASRVAFVLIIALPTSQQDDRTYDWIASVTN